MVDPFIRPVLYRGYIVVLHKNELVHTRNFYKDYKAEVAEVKRMYALQGRAERRRLFGLEHTEVILNIHLDDEVITEIF